MKYREIIKLIEKDGWAVNRLKGSHHVYKHPKKQGLVIIAVHRPSDDIPKGTENAILKQAGLKLSIQKPFPILWSYQEGFLHLLSKPPDKA